MKRRNSPKFVFAACAGMLVLFFVARAVSPDARIGPIVARATALAAAKVTTAVKTPKGDVAPRLALSATAITAGTRLRVTSHYTIAQFEGGEQIQETVHDADYEIEVTGVDGERIMARVTFFRDDITTHEGSRVVKKDARAVDPVQIDTTRESLLLLRTPQAGRTLLPTFPTGSVRDGQTWTHSTPLVVATFPVDVKQTLTASAPSAGRAELALDAHGETLIGDTGVTLAITATGRSVVDPRSSDVPLALKTTYRCAATGGPGLDSESVVTISITTSLKTDRS